MTVRGQAGVGPRSCEVSIFVFWARSLLLRSRVTVASLLRFELVLAVCYLFDQAGRRSISILRVLLRACGPVGRSRLLVNHPPRLGPTIRSRSGRSGPSLRSQGGLEATAAVRCCPRAQRAQIPSARVSRLVRSLDRGIADDDGRCAVSRRATRRGADRRRRQRRRLRALTAERATQNRRSTTIATRTILW